MDIETYNRREKMLKLREELLAVEEDRMAGRTGTTVDELDAYLDDIIEEVQSMAGNETYKVIVSDRAKQMPGTHIRSMAQVNKEAASDKKKEIVQSVFYGLISLEVRKMKSKRAMWIFAAIPMIVTSIVLQFMPDTIPMHHDLAGNTDRWGSKMESFIFPIIILLITLFWNILICIYEKKAVKSQNEKEQMEARTSAKLLSIVGISQAIMFGVLHYFILYASFQQAIVNGSKATIDIAKVSCILCGIMLIVLGNYMTKSKKNAVIGLRTSLSIFNDNTWRKSNRFGAICIIIAGGLTVVTSAFANGIISTIFLLLYIIVASVLAVIYSKKVYDNERKKEQNIQRVPLYKFWLCAFYYTISFRIFH